ncbi:MAG: putative DNA binding domain-containing protein [Draconibacterium sp.]|nr:putative DNA binding domain-containing protein [Draconibacterium sp.]
MTNDQVRNIILSGENQNVEFKLNFNFESIISICAFSNSKGGKLIIGVNDKGNISGVEVNHEILKEWINQVKTVTQPSLVTDYEIMEVDFKQIVVFNIAEFPIKPVSVRGRYYKRIGASNHQLSADEIVELRFTSINFSFDSYFVERSFEELDKEALSAFSKKIEQTGRFKVSQETQTDLEKLGFISKGKLTRAAELLWGTHNTSIHIGRFKTPDMILDDIVIRSPLIIAVDEAMEFVKKNIGLGYEFTGDLQRKNRWQFPLTVIRELLLNSIVHKDYRNPTDIIIKIFDNKIEFSNPGGLLGDLKIEDLLTDSYQAKHRNKLLAEAFYLTGEIEKYGTGFIRIRKAMEEYPELQINILSSSDFMRIELLVKSDVTKDVGLNVGLNVGKYGVQNDGLNGAKDGAKEGVINVRKDVRKDVRKELNLISLKILETISQNPEITVPEIEKIVDLTQRTVMRYISKLKSDNYIKRIGGRKNGYWKILKNE